MYTVVLFEVDSKRCRGMCIINDNHIVEPANTYYSVLHSCIIHYTHSTSKHTRLCDINIFSFQSETPTRNHCNIIYSFIRLTYLGRWDSLRFSYYTCCDRWEWWQYYVKTRIVQKVFLNRKKKNKVIIKREGK